MTVKEPMGLERAPPSPAPPEGSIAWSLVNVSFWTVNVPPTLAIPAPEAALPLAIVRPEIVTFSPLVVIEKTPLVPPPLIVRSPAPGPWI